MKSTETLQEKVRLVYKKCCNYACECSDDKLRELLGVTANECRKCLDAWESANNR